MVVEKKDIINLMEFSLLCRFVRKLRNKDWEDTVPLSLEEKNFFAYCNKEDLISLFTNSTVIS